MPDPFPLRHLLDHRRRQEERRQNELAQAEIELARTVAALRAMEARRDAVTAELARMKHAPQVAGNLIQAVQHGQQRAERDARTAGELAAIQRARTNDAHQMMVVAAQGRLMLERLRDSFERERRAEAARAEERILNEMALTRWNARRSTQD